MLGTLVGTGQRTQVTISDLLESALSLGKRLSEIHHGPRTVRAVGERKQERVVVISSRVRGRGLTEPSWERRPAEVVAPWTRGGDTASVTARQPRDQRGGAERLAGGEC